MESPSSKQRSLFVHNLLPQYDPLKPLVAPTMEPKGNECNLPCFICSYCLVKMNKYTCQLRAFDRPTDQPMDRPTDQPTDQPTD